MSMDAFWAPRSASPEIANDQGGFQSQDAIVIRQDSAALAAAAITGGLIAGALNLGYGFMAFSLTGATPVHILQCIASGLFGPAAFNGGLVSASIGLILHFGLSIAMAGAFVAAATKLHTLLRQPVLWGALYGVGLFFLMHYVVVPLSAAPVTDVPPWPLYKAGLIVHAFLVGVPMALAARHFLYPSDDDAG